MTTRASSRSIIFPRPNYRRLSGTSFKQSQSTDDGQPIKILDHQEYLGPPCPRSNLRPIKFASPFTLVTPNSSLKSSIHGIGSYHPYSLQEFSTPSTHLSHRLEEIRNKLEIEDLEWTLFRKRIENLNQSFWEKQSTKFESLEIKEQDRVNDSIRRNPKDLDYQKEKLDLALDDFYQRWLLEQKKVFMDYNLKWWQVQLDLMLGSWRAYMRMWRWRVACWSDKWTPR